MTRRHFHLIGGLLLAAAAAAAYLLWGAKPAPAYRLAKIERGNIVAAVSATGTLNPVVSVQVGSQVSGQVKEIYVDYNSQVSKGQLIARIDPEPFQLRVNQALADLEATRAAVLTQLANVAALRAEVSRARVSVLDAQRDFQRNQALFEKNFVSAAVRDKSQAAFEIAREQLKTAEAQLGVGEAQVRNSQAVVRQREAQLAAAKVDLEHTAIKAPVDGVVISRSVDAGQTVAASLQAPTLFLIARNLTDMQVDTSIDEAEVGRVRVGQEATFTVDSFPGRTFSGKVVQVRKAPQVVQNVVTYIAVVSAPNPDLILLPGMTANVRIVVDTRQGVLKVPNAALRFRPAGVADARLPAAEAPSAKGGGQQGAQARDRLVKELGLDAAQQAKLEAIFNETRDRIRAINTEDQNERRQQAERLRAESRARIAEILNPEQRKRYEEMTAARAAGGASGGRVWILGRDGKPQPLTVRVGLTDGTHGEVLAGELTEGMEVIVGTAEAGKGRAQPASGPRFGF
ncbi:MAG: efflux RND transporter periplasmic adaptor subunit [Burkholderiales bacterium]